MDHYIMVSYQPTGMPYSLLLPATLDTTLNTAQTLQLAAVVINKPSTMDVFTFFMLILCATHCYGQNTQHKRKLNKLQVEVDNLRDLALDLRLDIHDIQSWRNATAVRSRDTDNECVDSELLGRFEQSLDNMERQVKYIIKGLEGEKIALREKVENISEEVRHTKETSDAKLIQIMLKTESRDSEINEQLNRMSKQLETSRKNYDEVLGQLKAISNRPDGKDDAGIVKHRDEQYYINMKQDGWLQFNSYLYKYFREHVNFDTAVKRCEDQDASLVEIDDQEELQFLWDNFNHFLRFWVGATDRETGGEWRWLSGPLVRDGNWGPGQPNDLHGQDCMVMVGQALKYYDYPCERDIPYVCKRQ